MFVKGVGQFNRNRTFGGRLLDVGMFKLEGRHEEDVDLLAVEVLVLAEETLAVEIGAPDHRHLVGVGGGLDVIQVGDDLGVDQVKDAGDLLLDRGDLALEVGGLGRGYVRNPVADPVPLDPVVNPPTEVDQPVPVASQFP